MLPVTGLAPRRPGQGKLAGEKCLCYTGYLCESGGIGRRTGLRIQRFIHAGSSHASRTRICKDVPGRAAERPCFLRPGFQAERVCPVPGREAWHFPASRGATRPAGLPAARRIRRPSGPDLLRCWPPSGEIVLPALSGSGRPCPAAVRSLVPDAPLRAARRPFPPFRQRVPAILTGTLPCLSLAAGSRREDGAGRLKSAVLWAMRSDCRGWRVTRHAG